MSEILALEQCSAYVSARATLAAVHGLADGWPIDLGDRTRRAAVDAVHHTAIAATYATDSAGRRQCLREAIRCAIGVAALLDAASAMGFGAPVDPVRRAAGRTIALLAICLHASSSPPDQE